MSIKIPVSAEFDSSELNKQIGQINARIKSMGDAIAKANGTKFEPITLKGKEDLKFFVQQSEKLLKVQGELRNRMVRSEQAGKNPFMASWSQMYPNEATRLKRQAEALVFMGASFSPGATPPARRPSVPAPSTPPANSNQPSGGNNQWWQQSGRRPARWPRSDGASWRCCFTFRWHWHGGRFWCWLRGSVGWSGCTGYRKGILRRYRESRPGQTKQHRY